MIINKKAVSAITGIILLVIIVVSVAGVTFIYVENYRNEYNAVSSISAEVISYSIEGSNVSVMMSFSDIDITTSGHIEATISSLAIENRAIVEIVPGSIVFVDVPIIEEDYLFGHTFKDVLPGYEQDYKLDMQLVTRTAVYNFESLYIYGGN